MKKLLFSFFLLSFSSFAQKIVLDIETSWRGPNESETRVFDKIEVPLGVFWELPDKEGHLLKYKLKIEALNPNVEPDLLSLEVLVFEKREGGDFKVNHAKLQSKMKAKAYFQSERRDGDRWEGEYDLAIFPLRYLE